MKTLDLITKTPLIFLDKISENIEGEIYGKAEFLQPGGSVKDRAALQIIKDAYENRSLSKGRTVVEMTSGNMGSGLAVVCRQFGNPFVAVMPRGNSPERLNILKALGAEIVLTDQVDGSMGMVTGKDIEFAVSVAREIAAERKAFYADQFNNPSSTKAHYLTTGPEILTDLKEIDVFVASVGSGGTFTGTSKYLKSKNSKIKCIAVEPLNASILKTGKVVDPRHIIQGTGYSIVPPHWDPRLADDIITLSDSEVKEMTRKLALDQGLYVGYSAGANVLASLNFLKKSGRFLKIVTVLCDTGYKYSDIVVTEDIPFRKLT